MIHTEVQAQQAREFPYRMFEYYALLRLRTKTPVYPVALLLVPGTGGISRETYTESLLGDTILEFGYAAVSLPDLSADRYLESPNPLGPALASLMKPSAKGRARQKLESMLRVARSQMDDARKSLLAHVVESFVKLNRRDREEYASLIRELPKDEVNRMVTIFEQRGFEKGIERGIERGIGRGIAEGLLIARRVDIAKILRARFPQVHPDLDARLEAIDNLEVLDRLFDRVVTARTIEEVGIPEPKADAE